jgi:hypothetical protein
MAEVVSEEHGAPKPVAPAEEVFFRNRQREMVVNQRRFGLAYLVLAIGVGVAVGLAIVLIGRGTSHHAKATNTVFKPTASGELGAKQIARHVDLKYRQADGSPLVSVVGERPNYQGQPLLYYLIRPHDATDPNKDIAIFNVGDGIMYSMCGLGKNCATSSGGSTNEAQLLKREALELSFDTFKSDSSVQTVTTLLPPFQQGTLAIIFRRSDLARQLGSPLSNLLPEGGPLKPGDIKTAEIDRIDAIEAGSVYLYDVAQGPDGNAYLRLDPLG